MARRAFVVLSLALGLTTGCFVFDEIDQGREVMKKHSGRQARPDPAEEAEAPEEDEGPGLIARVQQYFQGHGDSSSSGPERSPDDEIVTCDLQDDGLTFTHESDCLARGGTPR